MGGAGRYVVVVVVRSCSFVGKRWRLESRRIISHCLHPTNSKIIKKKSIIVDNKDDDAFPPFVQSKNLSTQQGLISLRYK